MPSLFEIGTDAPQRLVRLAQKDLFFFRGGARFTALLAG